MRRHEEIKHSHLLQILHALAFFSVWILDSFLLRLSTILSDVVPLIPRVVAAAIIILLGDLLIANSHKLLFSDSSGELITSGAFAYVRHPMYLGILLTYLGFFVATLSLLSLVPYAMIINLYRRMADYEEQLLEERFGRRYREYARRVPKWIPRLMRRA